MHRRTVTQRGAWAVLLWPFLFTKCVPLDCQDCPSISQEKLLDRVIQHAELIYRVSEESCTLFSSKFLCISRLLSRRCFIEDRGLRWNITYMIMTYSSGAGVERAVESMEEMFVPFPLRLQRNQAGYACITKALPIPSSKSEIQQISDQWLLHSVLLLVQSWIEPLVYLQTTLDRYDNAPELLLNKTKWLSEKLLSLEQGILVLITKMLNDGMVSTTYSEHAIFQYDVQLEMLESIMKDYTLFNCFKKDAHKMETFLKLLKCRQTDKYNCA